MILNHFFLEYFTEFNFQFCNMPHFRLETNVSKSKVTPELLKKLSAAVAKTLGKPESVNTKYLPNVFHCDFFFTYFTLVL